MHGVGGRGDGGAARRAQHAAHEGGEGALLLAVEAPSLGAVGLIAVAVARALGARGRGLHLAGELLERRRLAQARALLEARGLGAVRGLRVDGARRAELLVGVGGRCGVGARNNVRERVADKLGAGGQPARRGGVVEAVGTACIYGAGFGERGEERRGATQ